MHSRLLRIVTVIISFFFLAGFVPIFSLIGPSVTAVTSGNIYKAGVQFIVNQSIEKETGKDSLSLVMTLVEDEITKKDEKNSIEEDLRILVEKRIKITRKKLDNQNLQKMLKKRIEVTRSILNLNNVTQ